MAISISCFDLQLWDAALDVDNKKKRVSQLQREATINSTTNIVLVTTTYLPHPFGVNMTIDIRQGKGTDNYALIVLQNDSAVCSD